MSNYNIAFDLEKREDKNGKPFFICKVKAPVTIDLEKGATFFVFLSEEGLEQLQIAPFQERNDKSSYDDDKKSSGDKPIVEVIKRRNS